MTPSKPLPPMKMVRWFHSVGMRISKTRSRDISPRTKQCSSSVPLAGTNVAFVTVAPWNVRPRKARQRPSGVLGAGPLSRAKALVDAPQTKAASKAAETHLQGEPVIYPSSIFVIVVRLGPRQTAVGDNSDTPPSTGINTPLT